MDTKQKPDPSDRIVRFILWVAVVVVGGYALMTALDGVMHTQWYGDREVETWLALGSLLALPVLIVALVGMYGKTSDQTVVSVAFIVLIGALSLGWVTYKHGDYNEVELLYYYCAYGATSESQLSQCLGDVRPGEVYYSDTPAAVFARGDQDCGTGAGPFCDQAFQAREASEALADYKSGQ